MPKILFYTHAFAGGGAELVFARLARALADAGHEVIFAADHQGHDAPCDHETLKHIRLASGHVASTRELAGLMRREKPDASFSALGAQNLKHLVASVAAGRLDRCVLGYHGFAVAEPKLLSRLSFWLTPVITRLAARTVCVSDALREDVVTRWRGSKRRTLRIYNPVAYSATDARARAEAEPLVLACGRLVPVKRFQDLVAAFAAMKTPARLALVGEGVEREAIAACVQRFGLGHRVEMPGHVADMTVWYERASCLAVASHSESFGLTVAEALTFGLPVVSTDCGGPSEILEGGRLGRLVPVGDIAALSRALDAALTEPGDPAPRRKRAEAFALPTIRDAYLQLALSLASDAGKAAVAGE